MKKNKIILIIIALLVLLGGGLAFWQISKNKQAEEKRKADTIVLETEGYNVSASFLAPTEIFNREIDDSLPRYPKAMLKDSEDTYGISVNIDSYSKITADSYLESAKKRSEFTEISADEQAGSLGGYAFEDSSGAFTVRLFLGEKDSRHLYLISYLRAKNKDGLKAKEVYDKSEVQDLLRSARADLTYQAPERDYISDAKEVLKIKKLESNLDDFELTQESSNSTILVITGKKSSYGLYFSIMASAQKTDMDTQISMDSDVKSGKYTYLEAVDYSGAKVRLALPEKIGTLLEVIHFYAEKDGVIMRGKVQYPVANKETGKKLLDKVFENLSVDPSRIK